MKKYILFASAVALLCSSCEMKDELLGKETNTVNGSLALNVLAEQPKSMSRAEVNTDDFEVVINGTGDLSDVKYTYTVAEMPTKVNLPVGTYTVTAHTAGELERKMSAPYYLGETEVKIEANLTSSKEISCTMANSRISMKYSAEFLETFASWTITVDDGTDQALLFTEQELEPADVYWYFKNETKNMTVNIRAVTKKGNNVEATATYNKLNSEEGYTNITNENFTGGDAITINFMPIEADVTTGTVTGINIVNNVTFDENGQTVTMHLVDYNDTPAGNDPTPPASNDPIVITEPNGTDYLNTGVTYTQYYEEVDDAGIPFYLNYPKDVALHFEVPNGLKHLYVLISGSDDFEVMTGLMGLTEAPYGLDLTDSANEYTAEIAGMDLFTMPTTGATVYDFAFSEGIWRLLPGFVGRQCFKLRAEDNLGNVKESTLVVTINAME